MPEIAEVARIVHHLRRSLVGKTVAKAAAVDDASVFGKVGTSGAAVAQALQGKTVVDAGQQGKYFWLIMSSPPHVVMHFGMTGWLHIRGEPTAHYRPKVELEPEVWPPKYWKFTMETAEPTVEAAFTDARRFGRVRLVDCAAAEIRNTTPLKENGPDPVIDQEVLTESWLKEKVQNRHVPIKALLLDQAMISGIGNWVGDEILYNAQLHPEQYSDTFSDDQIKRLHASIQYVCQTAVDALGDSDKFPDTWLFPHRWGKGKKDVPQKLPNGVAITHITVGGRTSCVVPSVQKKTGAVAGDLKRKTSDKDEPKKSTKRSKAVKGVEEEEEVEVEEEKKPVRGRAKAETKTSTAKAPTKKTIKIEEGTGRRRSTRTSSRK